MLHHVRCWLWILIWPAVCVAIEPTDTQRYDVVTESARQALQTRLARRTVLIERRATLKAGYTLPGDQKQWVRGWLLKFNKVITASSTLQLSPIEANVKLFVHRSGQMRKAAVERSDERVGVAVLILNSGFSQEGTVPDSEAPKPREIWMGRPAFAWSRDGVPHRLTLGLPQPGEYAYYWRADGMLPLGTPLTDAKGQLLTMVGSRALPGVLLLLPPDALAWAFNPVDKQK